MGRAGLLVIILGIAGLFAHRVITVPPKGTDFVAGGSWVAVGIGVVLLLTAIAQHGYGYGVFPLTLGVGILVADWVTHFSRAMHDPQPLLGLLVTLLIGAGAVSVCYAGGGENAVVRLPLFAVASLVSDIFVDFGAGWDDLVNLSTAAFAAAFVITAAVVVFVDDTLPGSGVATDYYGSLLLLAAGIGTGVAVVLVTTVATFDLPGFVDFLLTAAAVVGGYLVVPLLAFLLLCALADDLLDNESSDVVGDAIDNMEHDLAALSSLVTGFAFVAALAALIFGEPPDWLVAVLVVVAVAAAAAATRTGYLAFTELARLIKARAVPGRIAEALSDLRRSDPVFRLLPHAGTP
ncbi:MULTISPECIES: hypothetical protein [unclassified Amycolatopsis]|uniref:hypothetical protein n=1 Tax=unclassified Amycolatopsis TaxID=2618356 RepID=UPI002875DB26|nr:MULTISPECIES: hypothetical protein [unclassified Amycolatopsis]MDS0140295.1 hypothetical protein [Amycolatopsis sp. 505]MDS0149405.1 hypothetical protein [Amycolatopsis sp. CM201R]